MLILLSPAKTFNSKDKVPQSWELRQPTFLPQANQLATQLAKLSVSEVEKLLDISEKLAELNVNRYQSWEDASTQENAKPAAYAFWGDVNKWFNAYTLDKQQMEFADEHVIYLSGMYGALRPLDFIQEYRLEMGIAFATSAKCKNLYQYWSDTVTNYLNERIVAENIPFVVNLASKEYFSVVNFAKLKCPSVEIVFKDERKGKHKVISVIAKRSRGLMARWLVENQVTTLEQIKEFNVDGYYFKESDSSAKVFTFYRDEVQA